MNKLSKSMFTVTVDGYIARLKNVNSLCEVFGCHTNNQKHLFNYPDYVLHQDFTSPCNKYASAVLGKHVLGTVFFKTDEYLERIESVIERDLA